VAGGEKIPFGAHKGSRFRDLPDSYLHWIVKELSGGDLDHFAVVAEAVLEDPQYKQVWAGGRGATRKLEVLHPAPCTLHPPPCTRR